MRQPVLLQGVLNQCVGLPVQPLSTTQMASNRLQERSLHKQLQQVLHRTQQCTLVANISVNIECAFDLCLSIRYYGSPCRSLSRQPVCRRCWVQCMAMQSSSLLCHMSRDRGQLWLLCCPVCNQFAVILEKLLCKTAHSIIFGLFKTQ